MRQNYVIVLAGSLFISLMLFGGAVFYPFVKNIEAAPVQSHPDYTDHIAGQTDLSIDAAPSIWLGTESVEQELSVKLTESVLPVQFHLITSEPVSLQQTTCPLGNPVVLKQIKSDHLQAKWSLGHMSDWLATTLNPPYFIQVRSPLENVESYALVDGANHADEGVGHPAYGCEKHTQLAPDSLLIRARAFSTPLDTQLQ